MKTKSKPQNKFPASKSQNTEQLESVMLANIEYKQIETETIDFSPLNYRKYISEEALNLFAHELRQHGIISPLLIRPLENNRYELVAGERRLGAARIAGLAGVPAAIVNLSDEQVVEIQLSENLQRENPHPIHEAQAIGQMQRHGLPIDEIAARLGKSVQFVYARIKLLALIEPFQEMVFANVINLQDALQIATLSETSQLDFYHQHCVKWKKDKNFRLHNLEYYLRQYRFDLKQAPFNIKDKNLLPEAGSCSNCPSNSATLKTLFPDEAKKAICSNKDCYNSKCKLHFLSALKEAINTYQPAALVCRHQFTEMGESIIQLTPKASTLPLHNYHEISVIVKPTSPEKDDFTYDDDDGNPELDEEELNSALEDYYRELENYNLQIQSGHYQVAILLDNTEFTPVYFSPEKVNYFASESNKITAKDVQSAIRSGKATPELLQSEIDRINQREIRALELDSEKVQLTVHKEFTEKTSTLTNECTLTNADMIGSKLIIYQSLDYSAREQVRKVLFPESENTRFDTAEELYTIFGNLSTEHFCYLIRMAICSKSESKFPSQHAAHFLYRMAKEAGIDVEAIEDEQDKKAMDRKEKQDRKIADLKRKIEQLA